VIFAAVWITGVLKVFGAALALALVQPWGRRLPRRPVTVLALIAAVGLTLYGGLLEVTNILVAVHVVKPSQTVEWKALLWHLWVWDMSFFVWGILFAVALRGYRRMGPNLHDGKAHVLPGMARPASLVDPCGRPDPTRPG
jgi:hypothetical protein